MQLERAGIRMNISDDINWEEIAYLLLRRR